MMKRYFAVVLFFSALGFAQEIKHKEANWFAYMGSYNSSPKWGYSIEAQFRLNDQLRQNNQNVFRKILFKKSYRFT